MTDPRPPLHGRPHAIRLADSTDRNAIQRLVSRLSLRSRRLRFFAPIRELGRQWLDTFTQRSPRVAMTALAVLAAGSQHSVVAMAQYAAVSADTCEIAVVVEDRYQGCGIGTALLDYTIELARKAGFTCITADVLPENEVMLHIVQKFDFALQMEAGAPMVLRATKVLAQK